MDDPDDGTTRSFGNSKLGYKHVGVHRYFALSTSSSRLFVTKPPLSFYWITTSFYYTPPRSVAMSPSTVSVISQFHVSLAPLDSNSPAVFSPALFVVVLDLINIAGGTSLQNIIGVFSSYEKAAQAGIDELELLNRYRSPQAVFQWIRTQPKLRGMSRSGIFQNSVGDSMVLSIEEYVLDRVETVEPQRRTRRVGR